MKKKTIFISILIFCILLFIIGAVFTNIFQNKEFATPIGQVLMYLSMIIISCLCFISIAKKPDYLMEKSGLKYLPIRILAYVILIVACIVMIVDSYNAIKDLSIGVQKINICDVWTETKTCGKGHCDYLLGKDGGVSYTIKITEKHKEIKEYLVDHNCIDVEYYKNINVVYKVKGIK